MLIFKVKQNKRTVLYFIDSNICNKYQNLDTKMQVTGSSSKYRHCLLDADVASSAKIAVRMTGEV